MSLNENDAKLIHDEGFEMSKQVLKVADDDYYARSQSFVCEDGSRLLADYHMGEPTCPEEVTHGLPEVISIYCSDGSFVSYRANWNPERIDYVLSTFPEDVCFMSSQDFELAHADERERRFAENDAKVLAICDRVGDEFDPQAYMEAVAIRDYEGVSLDACKAMLDSGLIARNGGDVSSYWTRFEKEHGDHPYVHDLRIDESEGHERMMQCKALLPSEDTERLKRMRDSLLDTSRITEIPRIAEIPGMDGRVIGAFNELGFVDDDVNDIHRRVEVIYEVGDSDNGDDFGGWLVVGKCDFDAGNQPDSFGDFNVGSVESSVTVLAVSVDEARQLRDWADRFTSKGVRQHGDDVMYGRFDSFTDIRNARYDDRFSGSRFSDVMFTGSRTVYENRPSDTPIVFPVAADAPLEVMRERFEKGNEFAKELEARDKVLGESLTGPGSVGGSNASKTFDGYEYGF